MAQKRTTKVAAKKTPAKKAAASKRPAKKVAAQRASGRKGPAKKASVVRRAAKSSTLLAKAEPDRDSGTSVEELVAGLEPCARELVSTLRDVVRRAVPEATEEVKWGMPVYSLNGLLCYICSRGRRIRFGFYHEGMQLTDTTGAPVGRGDMLHVMVDTLEDIQPKLFTRWVQQAARLNAAG